MAYLSSYSSYMTSPSISTYPNCYLLRSTIRDGLSADMFKEVYMPLIFVILDVDRMCILQPCHELDQLLGAKVGKRVNQQMQRHVWRTYNWFLCKVQDTGCILENVFWSNHHLCLQLRKPLKQCLTTQKDAKLGVDETKPSPFTIKSTEFAHEQHIIEHGPNQRVTCNHKTRENMLHNQIFEKTRICAMFKSFGVRCVGFTIGQKKVPTSHVYSYQGYIMHVNPNIQLKPKHVSIHVIS